MTDDLVLRNVRLEGRVIDIAVEAGVIAAVGAKLSPGDRPVVDGDGTTVLPGLHDHHIHLLATAAARGSTDLTGASAPAAVDRAIADADASLAPGRWLRVVGYHERSAGRLDRERLDRLVPDRPVRVQHRTGAQWTLNSAALALLDLDSAPPGVERDEAGDATGRLHRVDDWLRSQIADDADLDLAELGAALAAVGVTGVTDATPFASRSGPERLAVAARDGSIPQRVTVMGGIELIDTALPEELALGPVKVVIDDGHYPALSTLVDTFRLAHAHHRPVAVHCVTRVSLTLAVAAWREARARPGDRVEHGSVIPPELLAELAGLGLSVVTQPSFVAERGDDYLAEVQPDDQPHLYRCRSLAAAGIPVAGSSDAPYSTIDPWAAMRAAVTRTTPSGRLVGPDESMDVARAVALYLGAPEQPGGPARRLVPGSPADLVLIDGDPLSTFDHLTADRVLATVIAGRAVVTP